ncbi:MAG TPA: hypothetical protein EYQ40_00780 [Candidatus Marinimicrobia bacterium]|jgi:hypothetical protein|nr:hypothetical protein [Candidatus Neomarinimicrobiota bacterium]
MQNNFQLIKNIFINFILILIASVFSIFLLELFVNSFLPQFDPRGMVAYQVNDEGVPLLKYKNQSMRQWKNTGDYDVSVFSNELGLRNHKDIKTNYVDEIYVVGDSYSFGQGVEESERYSDQLEGLINKPIINISIPTDFQGYDRLINYAIKNGANIEELIIGVCMENDLRVYEDINKGDKKDSFIRESIHFIKIKLTEISALYNFVTSVIHGNRILSKVAKNIGIISKNESYDLASSSALMNSKKKTLLSSVKYLKIIREKYKIEPIILIVPSRSLWLGNNINQADEIHKTFIRMLLTENFLIIDPRESFEKGGAPMDYHFKYDGHWNAKGHQLVSSIIANQIVKNNLKKFD